MAIPPNIAISGSEKRKMYFFKIVLYLLIGCCYLFSLTNYLYDSPLHIVFYNFTFAVIFTLCFFFRTRHLETVILITGIGFQLFIFGHAYYLLPGKQIEAGLGLLTAILPIFLRGFWLWFFFVVNSILYHLVLIKVGFEGVFFAKYLFYVILFIVIRSVLRENQKYEKELLVQRDKIERDATALREADELKTRFFANISHELRTPLTLLLSPIQSILNSKNLSDRNETYLKLMQQNGQKLLKRINELLELSRLGAKRVQVHPAPINIYQLCKRVFVICEGTAKLKGIELEYISKLDESTTLSLDEAKLEMILSNFLSNALKFTSERGSITLEIDRQNDCLQISVSDTGIGIPREDLKRIFDRFHQVKSDAYHEGTGIGLALCKELAELQNGSVWAESRVGEGSVFHLQLPWVATQMKPKIGTWEEPRIDKKADQLIIETNNQEATNTILVVEDNEDLRQYMQMTLSPKYQVWTAENGQVALEILKQKKEQPALVLTDLMMPVMDGHELLQQLKSKDATRHLPVLVLTAQQTQEVKIETLRIGIDDYLTKPFVEAELLARVDNLVNNAEERLQINTAKIETLSNKRANTITIPTLSEADAAWLKTVENTLLKQIGNSQFKLSDLAHGLHLTPRSLQQKIKALTGQTPKKYQRSIQLHEARKILKSGRVKTVSELSYELGFEDQHYFSSLYRKEFGVTPKEEMI